MFLKKNWLGLLLSGMVILSAGCGGGEPTEQADTAEGPEATTTTSDRAVEMTTCPETASAADVPEGTITGEVNGRPFVAEQAIWNTTVHTLKIRQGDDTFAEEEVEIFTFIDEDMPEGQTIKVGLADTISTERTIPHTWFSWRMDDEEMPQHKTFMSEYTLYLEFGEQQGDTLPGKLYVCAPGSKTYQVAGTFNATTQ